MSENTVLVVILAMNTAVNLATFFGQIALRNWLEREMPRRRRKSKKEVGQ